MSKFAPPHLTTTLVVRNRLLHGLDTAQQYRLTLLSAGAGWGKTSLLSMWANRQRHPLIWVSLDATDTEPARFWITLIGAIQRQFPVVGAAALALLHGSEPPPASSVLAVLLDDLAAAAVDTPTAIVLDDYHVIDDPTLHEAIVMLVEHLPPQVRLILATRVDPDLPLARWRARGLLAELRTDDLRFRPDEAHELFAGALDAHLGEPEVRQLAQRTEGWAVGLHLTVLMLRHQADRSAFVQTFVGSHRFLLDYVHDEILQRQPPHIQRFLLRIAILRDLNAALCTALTDEPDSAAMLHWLERHNLFVVPLDDARRSYRIHDLFREVLLTHLRADQPKLLAQLHQRAARWYAAQGDLREAIVHAFAARDEALAGELIVRAAPERWLNGDAHTIHIWLHALSDEPFRRYARLALDTALHLPEAIRPTDTTAVTRVQLLLEQTLLRVEAGLRTSGAATLPAEETGLLERRLRLLRCWIDTRALVRQGDITGLRRVADEAAALAEQEDVNWRVLALSFAFWLAFTFRQVQPDLVPRLVATKEQAQRTGDQVALLRCAVFLGHLFRSAGQLHLLEQECREGIERAQMLGMQTAALSNLHLTLAEAYYAWNRLEEAAAALETGVALAQVWNHWDQYLWGVTQLARLRLARGDHAAAVAALDHAETVVQREHFLHWVPAVAAARVRLWLATGDRRNLEAWVAQNAPGPDAHTPSQDALVFVQVEVLLTLERPTAALELLERYASQLDQPGYVPSLLTFLALHMVALHQTGLQQRANAAAARLIALAEPEKHLRVFLDIGIPMRQALHDLAEAWTDLEPLDPQKRAFVARLLAAFGPERDELPRLAHEQAPAHLTSPDPLLPNEAFTQREREVLELLVAGASNQEIAEQLVVSLATAKKHVSNILGKLGVATRAQAIARVHDRPEYR